MKIAVSGKGGVGKTTISASIARHLRDQGYQVYAIDADPDANLAQVLGIKEKVKPLVELEDVIAEKVGKKGSFYSLNPEVDDVVEDYSLVQDGIRFLRMGGIKKASSGCYCPENSFLNSIMRSLVFSRDEAVILDMGAGIEHLTRGNSAGVDIMLIICEASQVSLETARTIENLAREGGVKTIKFIANKVRSEKEQEFLKRKFTDDELLGIIPYSEELVLQGISENGDSGLLTAEIARLFAKLKLENNQ